MEFLGSEVVQQIIAVIMNVIFTALAAGLAWVGLKIKEYLTTKMGEAKYNSLRGFASDIVTYLMQHPAYKDWEGEQKKQFALARLIEMAQNAGLPLSDELADMLIEACYLEAKAKFGEAAGEWIIGIEDEEPE